MLREKKASHQRIKLYDPWFLFAIASLLAIGLVMVASASIDISLRQYGQPFHYLLRQLFYLGLGFILTLLILRIKIAYWQKFSSYFLLVSMFFLVVVLVPGIGREINGSMRWIGLGPIGIQVSEVAKFAVVIYLASYLERRAEEVRNEVKGFLKPMLILAIIGLLLLKEPNFGAAVVIVVTALAMMYLAGVRFWQFALLLGVVLLMLLILAVSSPYRMARLTTFVNPWAYQYASGYQLTQSLIAFGRGGWLGVGLGDSIQKLFYLPEAHTDFLFAVLSEELGLIGELVVVSLYTIFIAKTLQIGRTAQRAKQFFAAYTAYGFAIWVAIQAMINMGVAMGVLPTKGLTLPLLSYGGSSMLINCMVIAIILRIDYESRVSYYT